MKQACEMGGGHPPLSKTNTSKRPLSILLPHPCPTLKQGSVVLHLLYF